MAYQSTAIAVTHPARLRAEAMRHGHGSWSPRGFRYLEIGCGDATNLVALAERFPEARFTGLDIDAAAIDAGRAMAEACGIANVDLVASDFAAYDPSEAAFDYVVAHGVYSWVDREHQRSLLALLARAVAPSGVAALSYNTLPGWALRGIVRDAMRSAAAHARTDRDRLREARSRVAALRRAIPSTNDAYHALLAAELDLVPDKADWYLLSEYLAEVNEPLYLGELLDRASQQGLVYLGEMLPATAAREIETRLPAQLMATGMSVVEAQQQVDLLSNRQFRFTLLCREEAPRRDQPDESALLGEGWFAAGIAPLAQEPLLGPGKKMRFAVAGGVELEVDQPLLKAALLLLAEAFPEGRRVQELMGQAVVQLRERGLLEAAEVDEQTIDRTVADLVELCHRRFIELLPWTPVVERKIATRPDVGRLTRFESEHRRAITTPRHEPHHPDGFDRVILSLLDGTRDIEALVREIDKRVDAGEIALSDPERPRAVVLGELVFDALIRFNRHGLYRSG